MKVTAIIENKQGQVLGQILASKDRITIGRDSICTLSLTDDKVAPQENEIYLLNNECWLQVSKEGAPVTMKGKQYRTIKIEESCTLFFRQYTLKIILEKNKEIQNEATQVVESDDVKTRIISAQDVMTRIMPKDESTRIVERTQEYVEANMDIAESTRVLAAVDEKTRVVDEFDFKPQIKTSLQKTSSFSEKEETMSFGFEKESETSGFRNAIRLDQWSRSFAHINYRDLGLTVLATVVCLLVAKWLFFSSESPDLSLEKVALEQEKKLNNISYAKNTAHRAAVHQDPVDQNVQSLTREEYMRSLSSFFDKH